MFSRLKTKEGEGERGVVKSRQGVVAAILFVVRVESYRQPSQDCPDSKYFDQIEDALLYRLTRIRVSLFRRESDNRQPALRAPYRCLTFVALPTRNCNGLKNGTNKGYI